MESQTKTIRGIVVPAGWDEMGLVITLAIATYEEGLYIVEDSPFGRKLKAFLRQKVTVDGTVRQIYKDQVITVTTFRPDTGEKNAKAKDSSN